MLAEYFYQFVEIWVPLIIMAMGSLVLVLETVVNMRASYGRYNEKNRGIKSKTAWIIQESPSFLIPFVLCIARRPQLFDAYGNINTNLVLVCFFMIHYFNRSFIYSMRIKSEQRVSYRENFLGILFCSSNGLQIGHFHTLYAGNALYDWNFLIGCALFWLGLLINIDSDNRLLKIRKTTTAGTYKIPFGGLFEYVSAANYAGECLEWFGFALASWSLSGLAFCWFTLSNIGPRSYHHHLYYKEKFGDKYPKHRKALIPLIF